MRYVGPRQIVIDEMPTPVPFWTPDRSYQGMTVTLIGGGPSHALVDLGVMAGHRFIAINSSCRKMLPIATRTDALYFSDNSWNENRPELAAGWPGPVITSNRNAKARLGDAVLRIDVTSLVTRLRAFPDHVYASSGHGAACLAAVMGARRLLLVGFEGQLVDGRSHGHDDYIQHDLPAYAERFIPAWEHLAGIFRENGVEVINCTPKSAIRAFPFAELKDVLS